MNFLQMPMAILLTILFISTVSFSQVSNISYPVDPALGFSTGPAMGEKIPDFELPDQTGTSRSLQELLGKKGAVLDFYRSADW